MNCRYSFGIQPISPRFCFALVYKVWSTFKNVVPLSYLFLFWIHPPLYTSSLVAMLWQHQRLVCRITQWRSFLSKVRYIEGISDEGTRNLVRNNESSLYRGFVIQREFIYSLLARIQGTGLLVRNNGKFVIRGFVITGFHCIGLSKITHTIGR